MVAILAAVYLVAASPSSSPEATQAIQEQEQPTQQNSSAQPTIEEQKTESDQGASKPKNDESDKTRFFQFVREYNAEVIALSTAVMAVFTIALCFATGLLWKSGENHSERELQAYVFTNGFQIENFGEGNTPEATIGVKFWANSSL